MYQTLHLYSASSITSINSTHKIFYTIYKRYRVLTYFKNQYKINQMVHVRVASCTQQLRWYWIGSENVDYKNHLLFCTWILAIFLVNFVNYGGIYKNLYNYPLFCITLCIVLNILLGAYTWCMIKQLKNPQFKQFLELYCENI